MMGGSTPRNPSPGERRTYNIDAWVVADDRDKAMVSGVWLSEMSQKFARMLLKDLGLPVTKELVYRVDGIPPMPVADLRIVGVWDGWCSLEVLVGDGNIIKIASPYFAEMNMGKTDTNDDEDHVAAENERNARQRKPRSKSTFPLTCIVFDVESTGTDYTTAEICEIAALKIVDGKVVDEFETLVHIDGSMPTGAEEVHHIPGEMLVDAPHMTPALCEFLRFIGNDSVLVGHNIRTYDIPFIKRVSSSCCVPFGYSDSIDTLDLARKAWPNLPRHNMDTLRQAFGLEHSGAHRALKDCHDELAIYLALINGTKPDASKIKPVTNTKSPSAAARRAWSGRKKAKSFIPRTASFDESHPLYGKNVVISGEIDGGDYNSCLQAICDLGGHPQDNITKKTDCLVVGAGAGRGKITKAREYESKYAQVITIIDGDEFARLVGWRKEVD